MDDDFEVCSLSEKNKVELVLKIGKLRIFFGKIYYWFDLGCIECKVIIYGEFFSSSGNLDLKVMREMGVKVWELVIDQWVVRIKEIS